MLSKHVNQSRLNYYPVTPVIISRYILDVCPYLCLDRSIAYVGSLREDNALLISFIKPHHAIGSQALARWIDCCIHLELACHIYRSF